MAKYRKLHSKTLESLDVNQMPDDFTRLFWVLLMLGVCRDGRGIDEPSWLRSKIFPLRHDVTLEMISSSMDWFEKRNMVIRYEIGPDRRYFQISNWFEYQGNTNKESPSAYPPPPYAHSNGDDPDVGNEQIARELPANGQRMASESPADGKRKVNELEELELRNLSQDADSDSKTKANATTKNKHAKSFKEINLPENLNNPEFKELWMRWENYREEMSASLSPTSRAAQLKKASEFSLEEIKWVIEQTIINGWKGLFWDKVSEMPSSTRHKRKQLKSGLPKVVPDQNGAY